MNIGYMREDYSAPEPSKGQPRKMKKCYPSFDIGSDYDCDNEKTNVNLPITDADINKPMTVQVVLVPKKISSKTGEKGTNRCYSFEVQDIEFPKKSAGDDYSDSKQSRIESMTKGLEQAN